MKRPISFLAVLLVLLALQPLMAEDEPDRVEVSALLGDKAVITVNGIRHLLAVGETAPQGVKLVGIETDGARLEIDGEVRDFVLGSTQVRSSYTARETVQERVYRASNGMFRTAGTIDGTPVEFLVDTGATTVAMGPQHARRLGVDYKERGRPVAVQTASGVATAWHVTLNSVGVGKIKLRNIDAVVMEKGNIPDILLGMSFLNRLDIRHRGQVMVLEMKH